MSNFPALLSGLGQSGTGVPYHIHSPAEIQGTWSNVVIEGSIRSANWDGGGSLADGRDGTATRGFLLDSVAGAAQFSALYWATGSDSPLTAAGTWTTAGGWLLPTTLTEIASITLTEGIPVGRGLIVDLAVAVQASGITDGEWWEGQVVVNGIRRGLPFRQRVTPDA